MPRRWANYEAGIIYETNLDYTQNYVNGNPIDISYSFQDTISNSAGYQSYDISINTDLPYWSYYNDKEYGPLAAHYFSSTKPINGVSSRPALLLTFASSSDSFYKINEKGF